jgi:hypothetical protein
LNLDVDYAGAAIADKVNVITGVPVKALLAADNPYRGEYAALLERRQVAVDRAEADIRVLTLKRVINPLR